MKQDVVLKLAIQSGLCDEQGRDDDSADLKSQLENFAKLLHKHKTEELAQKIEEMPFGDTSASFAAWIRSQE